MSTMQAIQVTELGGPEVLTPVELTTPTPGDNELLVEIEAVGVNFIETYQRSGLYPMELPFTPGGEAAGTVTATGSGVTGFVTGDRVVSVAMTGAYAQYAVVAAAKAIRIPDGVDSQQAAAVFLQGMTAHYLCHDTFPLQAGDACLVHAGAGGVGLLLIQLCKAIGATVYTTVSTEEKAKLASDAGADHVIMYTEVDFVEEITRLSGGAKLDVVFDSVGRTTFLSGLQLLRPRGMMVLFGQSSGVVEPLELNALAAAGSLFVTRPTLYHYVASREDLEARAGDVLARVVDGSLDVRIGATYPLAEAAAAHEALQGRRTTGKVLLLP